MFSVVLLAICVEVSAETVPQYSAKYTADWLHNTRGGLRRDAAYLQNLDLQAAWTPSGPDAAEAFVHLLYNDATSFSDTISGDAQGVSNIDAPEAWRILELWYDQPLTAALRAKIGLYDLNTEFDAIETASLFLNSSHGIGIDFSQSGENGPSIFPSTSLALRLAWQINPQQSLKFAVLDGVPNDPDHPSKTTLKMGGSEGFLNAIEWEQTRRNIRTAIGYWRYTAEFDNLETAKPDTGNDGFYAFIEAPFSKSAVSHSHGRWFLRYGRAEEKFNLFREYLGAGVSWSPDEKLSFGVAVASAVTNRLSADPRESRETTYEITARWDLTRWLTLQPDLQYIVNPGVDPNLDNALVVGLRVELFIFSGA